MSTPKISYHNLRDEAENGNIPTLVGRREELQRLNRLPLRRTNNNALIVGDSGIGKTALLLGWATHAHAHTAYSSYALLQFDIEHIHDMESETPEEWYAEALSRIPASILIIDDFGRAVYKNLSRIQRFHRIYKPLLGRPDVQVVLALQTHEHAWLEHEYPSFLHSFETITLKHQDAFEHERILRAKMPKLNAERKIIVPDDTITETVSLAKRYPTLGHMPRAAIHLLDESLSLCATEHTRMLAPEEVARVVESKTGIPRASVAHDDLQSVRQLEEKLNAKVAGQSKAIATITSTLQRGKLGLRDPRRPLGSFLLLGPSGVGKTETAKSVAELMFGRAESFTRIDMSEFQQEHTVQRLIGAPPGYVGFEEGGALTNALKREPHSLILLDEIEKAHPKVFDIFLQVLDDGRITSGQNETIDARNAIIMATSNAAVAEILEAHETHGELGDSFVRDIVLPTLSKTFRLEFINRFDAVLVFAPLTISSLMRVAELEIKKIEQRLAKHNVQFSMDPSELETHIRRMADARFGARPIKRFIEETCEILLVESLLASPSRV